MTTLEDICTCEFGPLLGDGRTDSNRCPVHDMTREELVEYAANGWREVAALEARIEALEKPPRPSDLSDAVNLVQQAMTCIEAVPDGLWPAWDKELSEAFNCLDDAVGTPARCLEEAALVAKEDR